jgi:HEAT repeat protein
MLGQMGAGAIQYPEVLRGLVAALHDEDESLRSHVGAALGQMGPGAIQHPEVLLRLIAALRDVVAALPDKDRNVRRAAAEALGQMMGEGVWVFTGRFRRRTWRSVEELSSLKNG